MLASVTNQGAAGKRERLSNSGNLHRIDIGTYGAPGLHELSIHAIRMTGLARLDPRALELSQRHPLSSYSCHPPPSLPRFPHIPFSTLIINMLNRALAGNSTMDELLVYLQTETRQIISDVGGRDRLLQLYRQSIGYSTPPEQILEKVGCEAGRRVVGSLIWGRVGGRARQVHR